MPENPGFTEDQKHYSILVAIGGAVVLLVILHAIRGTPRTSTY